jgi:RNA polymerase sigma-70 factor (ECF subfamily)
MEGVIPEDAAEIAQEVLVSVFLKLEGFEKKEPEDTFRGWLRSLTQSRVRDFWRRANRRPPRARGGADFHIQWERRPSDESSASLESWHHDLVKATERVKRRCKEQTWKIFSHFVIEGFTAQETATAFGVSVPQVYLIRARVLRRLRRHLENQPPSSMSPGP